MLASLTSHRATRSQAMTMTVCLALALAPAPASGERVRGETPEAGVETIRDVGDVIYARFDEVVVHELGESFEHQLKKRLRTSVPAGTALTPWAERRPGWLCSREPVVRGRVFGTRIDEVACFRDVDDDGRFDRYFVGPGGTLGSGDRWIEIEGEGPAYRRTTRVDSDGFRRELVYLGIDDSTLRVQYRERSGNLARPAFDQDLTYRLAEGGTGTIRYQGLEIEVHGVGDGRIRYTLRSGMDR